MDATEGDGSSADISARDCVQTVKHWRVAMRLGFHWPFNEAINNTRSERLDGNMWRKDLNERRCVNCGARDWYSAVIDEHRQILNAITPGFGKRAAAAMLRHLVS